MIDFYLKVDIINYYRIETPLNSHPVCIIMEEV